MIAGDQEALEFLLAQSLGDQLESISTAIAAVAINLKRLTPPLERVQSDSDLGAGAEKACASGIGHIDQLDQPLPANGTGQPSFSSDAKDHHFFAAKTSP